MAIGAANSIGAELIPRPMFEEVRGGGMGIVPLVVRILLPLEGDEERVCAKAMSILFGALEEDEVPSISDSGMVGEALSNAAKCGARPAGTGFLLSVVEVGLLLLERGGDEMRDG